MYQRLPEAPAIAPADLAACRALLRNGSRSFFAAALLLPRRVHEPATALYAFCRIADDAIDIERGAGGLERLRQRLDRVYRGQPFPHPADRGLAAVVAAHAIPRVVVDALLEGFAWDAEGRQYDDIDALVAYAVRVAGTVGAMMAMLMGARDPDVIARACDLGIAMQLTNIARDVGEDARSGRLYLPLAWFDEAGIDPGAWLAQPTASDGIRDMVRRLLGIAAIHYARADTGIARLPISCRPGIGAARRVYGAIGEEVARRGFDSVTQRAVVPARRKAVLLAAALSAIWTPQAATPADAVAASSFLVDAVCAAPLCMINEFLTLPRAPWHGFDDRIAWLIDLFVRLDERGHAGGEAGV